jgi:23S rRNA pseudouridine1911/1915/1917 synthase
MAFLGHPIVGDKIYVDLTYFARYVKDGLDEEMMDRLKLPRLALHATQISFEHPSTKKQATFLSEMPALLKDFLLSQGF